MKRYRIVGEPFKLQTVVDSKWRGSRGFSGIYVADYKPAVNGSLWASESLWNEVKKGDILSIAGVQSVLGRSIDSIEKVNKP